MILHGDSIKETVKLGIIRKARQGKIFSMTQEYTKYCEE